MHRIPQPRGILVLLLAVRIKACVHERHLYVVLVVLNNACFKTGCTAAWHLCFTLVV